MSTEPVTQHSRAKIAAVADAAYAVQQDRNSRHADYAAGVEDALRWALGHVSVTFRAPELRYAVRFEDVFPDRDPRETP